MTMRLLAKDDTIYSDITGKPKPLYIFDVAEYLGDDKNGKEQCKRVLRTGVKYSVEGQTFMISKCGKIVLNNDEQLVCDLICPEAELYVFPEFCFSYPVNIEDAIDKSEFQMNEMNRFGEYLLKDEIHDYHVFYETLASEHQVKGEYVSPHKLRMDDLQYTLDRFKNTEKNHMKLDD